MIDYLIVGLGNKGANYQQTKHNVGQIMLNAIAEHYGVCLTSWRSIGHLGAATIEDKRCLLMKPNAFMNLSGAPITQCLHYYKISVHKLIVLHDDIDLVSYKVRAKQGGSSGGHNGIRSIDQSAGTNHYIRVRIGVDRPLPPQSVEDYVLSSLSKKSVDQFQALAHVVSIHLPLLLRQNIEMFNSKTNQEGPRSNHSKFAT